MRKCKVGHEGDDQIAEGWDIVFGDQSHRMASGVTNVQSAASPVPDDMGHALLVVPVAVLSLIVLLIVLARLEPRKNAQGVAVGGSAPPALEQAGREPSTPPQRV